MPLYVSVSFFFPIGTLFCFVEAGSHSVAYTDFKLSFLLPPPPKFWDRRCIVSPLVLKVLKSRSHPGLTFMAKSISYLFQILEGLDIPWLLAPSYSIDAYHSSFF